jgi:hypothetical protein
VAHTCNPSYSGGRGQEDRGSKANSLRHPILKKPITKRVAAQGEDTEFKPQYHKKKKKRKGNEGRGHKIYMGQNQDSKKSFSHTVTRQDIDAKTVPLEV